MATVSQLIVSYFRTHVDIYTTHFDYIKKRGKKLLINFLTDDDKNWLFLSLVAVVLFLLLLLLLLRTASALLILLFIWLAFVLICKQVCVWAAINPFYHWYCQLGIYGFETSNSTSIKNTHTHNQFISNYKRWQNWLWNFFFQASQWLLPSLFLVRFSMARNWSTVGHAFTQSIGDRWYWTIFRNVDARETI